MASCVITGWRPSVNTGCEKLFETEEAAHIRDRHLDYFIQFADRGDKELLGPDDLIWIEKMEIENDNFRTALSWSLESPDIDPQKALQLNGCCRIFGIRVAIEVRGISG